MIIEIDDGPTAGQEDPEDIAGNDGSVGGGADAGKDAGADGKGGDGTGADKGAAGPGEGGKTADGKPAGGETGAGKTLAGGADPEEDDKAAAEAAAAAKAAKPDPNEITEDLRRVLAEHYAAGDKKLYAQELRRLERVKDIKSLWGMYREMEAKFTSGGLVKVPGKDAKPEEVEAFRKATGVPDKPEGYLKHVKLENGAVIGEADKPIVDTFASAMHKAGASPQVMNEALNWYYHRMANEEADRADKDDADLRNNKAALKEELGADFRRETAAIKALFETAPGGADDKNENSLFSRLISARMPDGTLVGNDVDFMRQLIAWRRDMKPFATLTEDGAGGIKTAEARLAEIKALRKTDERKYYSNAIQDEELRLIEAIEKEKARA